MSPVVKTKAKEIIKKIPEQKRHLDFIGALLTVPVLLTVLILNLSNLQKKGTTTISPTPTPIASSVTPIETTVKAVSMQQPVVTPTTPVPSPTNALCNSDVGPISIDYPGQNQTVTDNPTCIDIAYQGTGYCAVVWAYKINNSSWSDYSNNSVCLYNLPQGQNIFYLKVKSLVSGKEEDVQRSFIYIGSAQSISSTPTPTVTNVPTPTITN